MDHTDTTAPEAEPTQPLQPSAPPFVAPEPVAGRAHPGRRLAAAALDGLIHCIVLAGAVALLWVAFKGRYEPMLEQYVQSFGENAGPAVALLFAMVQAMLGVVVYGALMMVFIIGALPLYGLVELLSGASPGKWMTGLCVAAPDCGPLPIGRAVVRYLIKFSGFIAMAVSILAVPLPFITLFAVGLQAVVVFGHVSSFGTDRLSLLDLMAKTAVCRRKG